MYVLLTSGGILRTAWAQDHGLVLLTAIFSAMVHDYEHLGLNNDFLVKTKHPLALVYNDRSPMEQHHLAAAFTLLQQADMNFLAGLPDDMQVRRRAGRAGCLRRRACDWGSVGAQCIAA